MSLREYIQNQVFARRADDHGCLVVYDPARRYRDIAMSMEGEKSRVIDVSTSVIEQREAAMLALSDLAKGKIHHLIVWLPAPRPGDNDAKQKDPFSVLSEIGAAFPQGDGDEYAELCRRAMPDHVSEINRMFEEGEPSFEMIEALDKGGGSWPKLKTLLEVNSPKEILLGILSPRTAQDDKLKKDGTWAAEARDFVERNLGHRLKTKGQTRQSIADELWRLILFSEFVFDSAGEVPASLGTVPRTGDEARSLVTTPATTSAGTTTTRIPTKPLPRRLRTTLPDRAPRSPGTRQEEAGDPADPDLSPREDGQDHLPAPRDRSRLAGGGFLR